MKHEKKRSKSRMVGYHYEGTFLESAMEKILEKGREAGVVVEFDTGRGSIVWEISRWEEAQAHNILPSDIKKILKKDDE